MAYYGGFQHPTEATTAVGTPMSLEGSAGPSSPKPFENDCVDDEVSEVKKFRGIFVEFFAEASVLMFINPY